jgi:serine/threonine-protein kinase RsbW
VEETVRNAIEHGNLKDKRSRVIINYRISGDRFTIEVEDEGAGFDHRALPDPTHGDNLMKNSGRGVYLVRRLMDKVEFNEKGNKVKLTKYI